jgi:hypothetical protein
MEQNIGDQQKVFEKIKLNCSRGISDPGEGILNTLDGVGGGQN